MRPPFSSRSEPLGQSACHRCMADEQHIVDLILHQSTPTEILSALCRYVGSTQLERQVAFFVLDDNNLWSVAAKGDLTPDAEAVLSRIEPEKLWNIAFQLDSLDHSFPSRWVRHLCSAAGESLGIFLGLSDSVSPEGLYGARIETVCRLATLAIEQSHLIADHAYRGKDRSFTSPPGWETEMSMQHITEMIVQQCNPTEILGTLCRHVGCSEHERQIAFFRTDGETWTLAAKGNLTQQAEEALARIDPAKLSDTVLELGSDPMDYPEYPLDFGWARHLFSGTGELLGILVGLSGGPTVPLGSYATRVASISRLAILALEQNNLVAELTFQANHDALTGLFNRHYYEQELGRALQQSVRAGGSTAILNVNLDRFRIVNDVLGPATGDQLLEAVGRRFRSRIQDGDTVARVGGDEFAILLPRVADTQAVDVVASRLLQSLLTPFQIDGHELFVSASIGISCSGPESTPESLRREASLALYQAKQAGESRSMFFHSAMATTPPERLEMERRLRFALARQEMLLHYQPQMHLASGIVQGAEALLRWRPPGLGTVSPVTFIPILEETGLIIEFGRWVLNEACRQGRQWMDQNGLRLRMGVNVSAAQIARPDFVEDIEHALSESGFPPDLLELELTESLFVGKIDLACRTFECLQKLGIQLALDDFGTGQSSLSYLHKLPFQRLKIDQSFIRGIRDGDGEPPLVLNIIRMAQGLGMSAIAEGVETPHQAELLRSLGCDEGQGYVFAKPLPALDFVEFCRVHQGGFTADQPGLGGQTVEIGAPS